MFDKLGEIRYRQITKLINSYNPVNKTILDLGAGNNAISNHISCNQAITIDAFADNNPDIVHDISKNIPLDNGIIDICIAGEIFEHIYHAKFLLEEIHRVLKPQGVLILSVPNIVAIKNRVSFLFGRIPMVAARADTFYTDGRPGHIRDFNLKEMKMLLQQTSFCVKQVLADGLSISGTTVLMPWMLPKTFQDSVIIAAVKSE
ncbi:methyltransferase domain-containing protein [Geobacter pelophilus]|uniref:Methyltransferase domain-containing protein n=1 Tax=Geoanaerobacter pelophilus TaxID=60036 RepID=A0AAW4KZN4_9BACT|nr:methyltransferase domain-containing protein [Geoanaerobacter pelophilus]MBT0663015.1 methyltransferase domain-containing protein [Geoanaerobacter pelophilus]